MMSSAGLAVWAKKNQCHHSDAKRASQRSRCSTIGMPSIRASLVAPWSTASRCAHGEPRSWPTTAYEENPSASIIAASAAAISRLVCRGVRSDSP